MVAASLAKSQGSDAASLLVAEKYISAFEKLAKTNNTMILPSNASDVSSLVAQAMTVYKNIQNNKSDADLNNAEMEKIQVSSDVDHNKNVHSNLTEIVESKESK